MKRKRNVIRVARSYGNVSQRPMRVSVGEQVTYLCQRAYECACECVEVYGTLQGNVVHLSDSFRKLFTTNQIRGKRKTKQKQ